MKRCLSILLALAIMCSMLPAAALAADFTDTDGHWGESSIERWADADVIHGIGGGKFNPNGQMTRAEAAQVFVNLLHLSKTADISAFIDVPADAWYADAIAKCVAAGILRGTGANTMDPTGDLTREQLFTMAGRVLGVKGADTADKTFVDSAEISGYARGYVNALINMGVLYGVSGNRLEPNGKIDRASVMTVLDRMVGAYVTEDGTVSITESGVTLIVAEHVTLTGRTNGLPIIIAADKAEVDMRRITGAAEVIVKTDGVSIQNAPVGTTVTTAKSVTGVTVNGRGLGSDVTVVVEAEKGSGTVTSGTGSTPPSSGGDPTEPDPTEPDDTTYTREDLEEAIVELAWDYYIKEGKIQYCSQELTSGLTKYYGATYRLTEDAAPEYGTSDTTIYSVCSDFVYKVYYEALGYRMFDSADYLDAVTTAMWLFCEDVALMRWMNAGYTLTADDVTYGVTTEKQLTTAQAREFLANWEENLRPGDVLLPTGHALLYIGDGYVVDCWGGKYNTSTGLEKFEAAGSVHVLHTVEDLFLDGTDPVTKSYWLTDSTSLDWFAVFRPLDNLVTDDGDEDPGNDLVADDDFVFSDAALSRLENPAMEINRTVDITPYGTVPTGGTLTYSVAVSNCSDDPDLVTFRRAADASYVGMTYTGLVVTETIPAGTALVESSISHNGVYENGVITWTLDLAAGETVELTYQVTVTAGMGSTITNDGGFVASIPSNSISNTVGGGKLSDAALTGLTTLAGTPTADWREQYNISRLGTDLEFAERVYAKAMGIGLDLPTVQEIIDNLLSYQSVTVPSGSRRYSGSRSATIFSVKEQIPNGYETVAAMLMDGYIGGAKMYFPEKGHTINEFKFDYLEPGDIIVYANTNSSAKVTYSQVMVYAGNNTLLNLTSDQELSILSGKESSNSNLAFVRLWQAYIHDVFFVLRPSQALADVNGQVYDGSEPSYGEEPADKNAGVEWGNTTLSPENLDKLAALTADGWKQKNTNFAEEVYAAIGIDITSATLTTSAANILKTALFYSETSAPDFNYELQAEVADEYQRMSAMLVRELRGGEDMVGYTDNLISVDDLEPGDILFLVSRSDSRYWVGVYLGEDQLLLSKYRSSGNTYQTYEVLDFSEDATGEAFVSLLTEDSVEHAAWECYFVLRPYLGFYDINNPNDEPSAGEEEITYTPLNEKNQAALLALAEKPDAWSEATNTAFAMEIYAAIGLDISSITVSANTDTIRGQLFAKDGSGKYILKTSTQAYAPALVAGLRGGTDMADAEDIKVDAAYTDLEPGDILFQAINSKSAYYVGVYLGEGKLLMRQYHKYGAEYTGGTAAEQGSALKETVLYDFTNIDNFTEILKTDPQSQVDFAYYFVLRPYRAVEDINTLTTEQGGEDPDPEPAPEPERGLSAANKAALLALAEAPDTWSESTNTAFAQDIYKAIGLDISSITVSANTDTIRGQLFAKDGSGKYILKTSTQAYAPALVAELRGGTNMAAAEDIKADFTYTDLEPGDILFQAINSKAAYYVGVYLGESKLLMRQYHKNGVDYTAGTSDVTGAALKETVLYDFTATDNFADILETDPQSNVDFAYYFVLRPSQAVEDINSLTVR